MRINPINSIPQNRYTQIKNNKQKNINSTLTNNYNYNYSYNTNVNFKNVTSTSLELVQKIPLSERLAALFENTILGDLILVGKDLSEAKKAMLNSTSLIKNVIKRAFFIPDDSLNGYLGFFKNATDDLEAVNLNSDTINLINESKTYSLEPYESFYVLDGDQLIINGMPLSIKSAPKINLSGLRKNFSKSFNFTNDIEVEIQKLNKKTISQLTKEAKRTHSKETFADVGGQDNLINELKQSILFPMKYPEAYENINVNRGFILYGPPGTGKTHISRALANEADAEFISLNGLELESKWVGESETNWRDLFQEAKSKQPCIVFIDEFDAVAKKRGGKDEYGDKVVDQILTLMSDLDNGEDEVYFIAATNNFDALDKAVIRSGRFGKHIKVDLPDLDGMKKIFEIHAKNKPIDENININALVEKLYNHKMTGADIKYIMNEAYLNGYKRAGISEKMEQNTFVSNDLKSFKIKQEDFDKAIKDFLESKEAAKERKPIGYLA